MYSPTGLLTHLTYTEASAAHCRHPKISSLPVLCPSSVGLAVHDHETLVVSYTVFGYPSFGLLFCYSMFWRHQLRDMGLPRSFLSLLVSYIVHNCIFLSTTFGFQSSGFEFSAVHQSPRSHIESPGELYMILFLSSDRQNNSYSNSGVSPKSEALSGGRSGCAVEPFTFKTILPMDLLKPRTVIYIINTLYFHINNIVILPSTVVTTCTKQMSWYQPTALLTVPNHRLND